MNDTTTERAQIETPSPAEAGHKARLRSLLARHERAAERRRVMEELQWKIERKAERLLKAERLAHEAVTGYLQHEMGLEDEADEDEHAAPLVLLDGVAVQLHYWKPTNGNRTWSFKVLPVREDV